MGRVVEPVFDSLQAEKLIDAVPGWTPEEIKGLEREIAGLADGDIDRSSKTSTYLSLTKGRDVGRDALRSLAPSIDRIGPDSKWWQVSKFATPAFYALDFEFMDRVLGRWLRSPAAHRVGVASEAYDKNKFWSFYWQLHDDGRMAFLFNASSFGTGSRYRPVDRSLRCFQLLVDIAKNAPRASGQTLLSWSDEAKLPGLGFDAINANVHLIPDIEFATNKGYAEFRSHVPQMPPWEDRREMALWRGTLWNIVPGGWTKQWRTRLCELSLRPEYGPLLDAGFTECRDPRDTNAVKDAGLMRSRISIVDMANFKYQIDIDGHTASWLGLFRKLCMGSVVLKVRSPFKQWYYGRLVPWENFVPVSENMEDLAEKILWLKRHDDIARKIGREGQELGLSRTYDKEVERARPRIFRILEGLPLQ